MQKATRVIHGEPKPIEGCMIVHYKVYLSSNFTSEDEPDYYESVISMIGSVSIGRERRLYTNSFSTYGGRKSLVDDFLNQKRSRRPATRGNVNGEIIGDARSLIAQPKEA